MRYAAQWVALSAVFAMQAGPALAQTPASDGQVITGLTPVELFDVASKATDANDYSAADAIYTALKRDPDVSIRNEARFRHGQLLAARKRFAEAAVEYRAILDEKPDAQRVRLELARTLAMMGNLPAARKALLQAQAGGLPPEVAQLVDQYAAALRSYRPFGVSFELSLAPSTNINRATSATTLDTIIAPFDLSADARPKSGLGIRVGGQAFARVPVLNDVAISARLSALSNLYRDAQFHDAIASGQIGAETSVGKIRMRLLGGRSYRWYGGQLFATTDSVSVNAQRVVGRKAQVELELGVGRADYRLNDLQDGKIYDASITYERAVSSRFGGSIALNAQRQTARDAGYATAQGGVTLLLYREFGKTTAFANAGLSRLEADARLFLFPRRRTEWLYRLGAGATFRQLQVMGFSPLVRLNWENNRSTVALYSYTRLGGEVGITRAF